MLAFLRFSRYVKTLDKVTNKQYMRQTGERIKRFEHGVNIYLANKTRQATLDMYLVGFKCPPTILLRYDLKLDS